MKSYTSPTEIPAQLAELLALLPEDMRRDCAEAFGEGYAKAADSYVEMRQEFPERFDLDDAAKWSTEWYTVTLACRGIEDGSSRMETLASWYSRGFRHAFEAEGVR